MRFSTVAAITAVLVAASGVAGCSGSSSGSGSGSATTAPAPEKLSTANGGAALGDVSGAAAPVARPGQAAQNASLHTHDGLPQMPSTVIKTGRLSIRLGHDGLAKSIDRAQQVVDSYGGFISSSNISSGKHET